MQQEQKNEGDRNNPEPFVIWKNARKDIKNLQRRRKQSEHYPTTCKKTRKMTVQLSHAKSLEEELNSFRSEFSEQDIQEDIQKQPLQNEISVQDKIQEQQEVPEYTQPLPENQLQQNIPFSCNEWELDKESPYLRSFNSMGDQIHELRLDD